MNLSPRPCRRNSGTDSGHRRPRKNGIGSNCALGTDTGFRAVPEFGVCTRSLPAHGGLVLPAIRACPALLKTARGRMRKNGDWLGISEICRKFVPVPSFSGAAIPPNALFSTEHACPRFSVPVFPPRPVSVPGFFRRFECPFRRRLNRADESSSPYPNTRDREARK